MRRLVTISVTCSIAFVACSHALAPPVMPSAAMRHSFEPNLPASSFHVLYNFDNTGGGGINPYAGLINVGGTFYGTTRSGGSTSACAGGCGTAYYLTMSGNQHQIYDFGSYKGDGTLPVSDLLYVNGTFYGTTRAGGSSKACSAGCGTVFSLTKGGKERAVYSFGSYKGDGKTPHGGLIAISGTLYGTTEGGGLKNHGSVFSITTSGDERVIYSFGSYKGDGLEPLAELTDVNGLLYGTTLKGGSNGGGAAFRVERKSGNETTLHSFGGGKDGAFPAARLLYLQGSLYGTTTGGGTLDGGTVFIMDTSGSEGPLHSFGKSSDGKDPQASLTVGSGTFLTLYGTTADGGTHGDGTIFSVTGSGVEKTLYSFAGPDGGSPYSHVLRVGNRLFGTTVAGGSGKCSGSQGSGCGTAFAFTP